MGILTDLIPLNYQEMRDRFLADPAFDPQFQYIRDFSTEELLQYGMPSPEYAALAQRVMDETARNFTAADLQHERGPLLTQETVTAALTDFLRAHQLENEFQLVWSDKFLSRAAVSDDKLIKLRLPCAVYERDLEGLMYHEIGTHVLRRVNYVHQPWYKKKKQFGFRSHLRTEEGLATIHALFPKHNNPLAYRVALYHLAVQKAQEGSFLEVWQLIRPFIDDLEFAFSLVTKVKRGLKDTSQPGGFTKDLVYFEGFVETSRFLIANDFPLDVLYYGKLAWEDIDLAKKLNPDFRPLLPVFYTDNPELYKTRVKELARANFVI